MLKASLPNDWSYELAEEVVRDYVQRNFVDKGMCADWAILKLGKIKIDEVSDCFPDLLDSDLKELEAEIMQLA